MVAVEDSFTNSTCKGSASTVTIIRHPKVNPFLQTPVSVLVANEYLNRIEFVDLMNSAVAWNADRRSTPLGILAKSIVLSTFYETRSPLYHVASRFEQADTQFLFGPGVQPQHFDDDALAACLDAIYEAGPSKLFSGLTLSTYTQYDLDMSRFHSDTSNLVMYGEYESCEEEDYDGIRITHGHSKANRPDKKQVGVGSIVNRDGIPLVSQALDGNKADCEWNQEAIRVLRDVLGDKLSKAVYIADCKLITMPNIHLLCQESAPVQFISRCPDAFYGKVTNQLIEQAYQEGAVWSEPLSVGKKETSTRYRIQEFTKRVETHDLRFLVVETSSNQKLMDACIEREREEFEQAVKRLTAQSFACEKDAQTAYHAFQTQHKKQLWKLNGIVASTNKIVYKRGRRAAHQPPQVDRTDTTWHIQSAGIERHEENITKKTRQTMTFVLVTNVPAATLGSKEILFTYKGQSVVEVQFHLLKTPSLASQVFLTKPERIEALMMLLRVALLVRALMQYQARQRVKEMKDVPRVGLNKQRYTNPTASSLLVLLRDYYILFDGQNRYHSPCTSFQEERLGVLLYLLDVDEDRLFMQ